MNPEDYTIKSDNTQVQTKEPKRILFTKEQLQKIQWNKLREAMSKVNLHYQIVIRLHIIIIYRNLLIVMHLVMDYRGSRHIIILLLKKDSRKLNLTLTMLRVMLRLQVRVQHQPEYQKGFSQ